MGDSKVPAIYGALQKVHQSLKPVLKTNQAPAGAGKFNYRGIDDALDSVHDLFVENCIIVTQHIDHPPAFFAIGRKSGEDWHGVGMAIRYRFVSTVDGSFVESGAYAEGGDQGDRAGNKAMANGLKYLLYYTFVNPPREPGLDSEAHPVPGASHPAPRPLARAPAPAPAAKPRAAAPATSAEESSHPFDTGKVMPFGKYKGMDVGHTPSKYLRMATSEDGWTDGEPGPWALSKCQEGKFAESNRKMRELMLKVLAKRAAAEKAEAPAREEEPPPEYRGPVQGELDTDDIPF